MLYALGKAHDDLGYYAEAFACYTAGGKSYLSERAFDQNQVLDYGQFIRNHFTPYSDSISTKKNVDGSDLAVFILGMPRSGTSLIEQIIASHPSAEGAGELSLLQRSIDGIQLGNSHLKSNLTNAFFSQENVIEHVERGDKYLQELKKYASRDVLRIVDKMPENFWWAGIIPQILPNAKIIHSKRHPLEICLSASELFLIMDIPTPTT